MTPLLLALAVGSTEPPGDRYYGVPIIVGDVVTLGTKYLSAYRVSTVHWWLFVPAQIGFVAWAPVIHGVNGRFDLAGISLAVRLAITALPWVIAYPLRASVTCTPEPESHLTVSECAYRRLGAGFSAVLQLMEQPVDWSLARTHPAKGGIAAYPWATISGGSLRAGVIGVF